MPSPIAVPIELTEGEREQLESWSRPAYERAGVGVAFADRACGRGGLTSTEVASGWGCQRATVRKWRNRFAEDRLDGLIDEPRPGQPRTITDEQVEEVIVKTLESTPQGCDALVDAVDGRVRSGSRRRRCIASGRRSGSSRTARRRGSCPRTRSSSPRSVTSSGCIWTRPSGRWCCASMRSPRSKRWTAPRRSCRCSPAPLSARPTTTSGTAPRASTPRWTSRPARWSAGCTPATARSSSRSSCRPSTEAVPADLDVHLVLDNSLHAQDAADQDVGCSRTRGSCCTSRRPAAPGWTSSSAGSLSWPPRSSSAPHTAPSGAQQRHPSLDRDLEQEPTTVRVDQDRRPDPRIHHPLLHTN